MHAHGVLEGMKHALVVLLGWKRPSIQCVHVWAPSLTEVEWYSIQDSGTEWQTHLSCYYRASEHDCVWSISHTGVLYWSPPLLDNIYRPPATPPRPAVHLHHTHPVHPHQQKGAILQWGGWAAVYTWETVIGLLVHWNQILANIVHIFAYCKTGGREGQGTRLSYTYVKILPFLGSPYWADGIKYFVVSWETVIHLISCPGPTAYCSPTPHHHHPLPLPCSIRQRHHHRGSTLGTGIKSYYILRPAM